MSEGELPKGPSNLAECEEMMVGKLEQLLPLLPAGVALEMGRSLVVDMRESAKTRRLMNGLEQIAVKAKESFNLRRSRVQVAMAEGFKGLLEAHATMMEKLLPTGQSKTLPAKRPSPIVPKPPAKPEFVLLSASDLRKGVMGIPLAGQEPIRTTGNIWDGWAPSDSHKVSDTPPKNKSDDNRS
jgi:hypothetical protein